jgi:hypothetical protein
MARASFSPFSFSLRSMNLLVDVPVGGACGQGGNGRQCRRQVGGRAKQEGKQKCNSSTSCKQW